jgi:hypothetical protein
LAYAKTLTYYENLQIRVVKGFMTLGPGTGVFVPGKLFQPNLMFVGKAGAYLSEEPSNAPL